MLKGLIKPSYFFSKALWHGYKVRSRVTSPDVKRACKRIASANSSATEHMKLCNRTRSALDYLLSCKNQTTILDALVSLGKLFS